MQLVLEVHLDDLVERRLGGEPEPFRTGRIQRPAQPSIIAMIVGSGSWRINRTACSPATRRSASICSPTVALSPGMDRVRRGPIRAESMVAARTQHPTADRGDANQCRTVSGTGRIASCTDEWLAQDAGEEARRGLVGLVPVGCRWWATGSRRRRRSRAGCSRPATAHRWPSACRSWSAVWRRSPPASRRAVARRTRAIEEENTSRGRYPSVAWAARIASNSARVPSRLTR